MLSAFWDTNDIGHIDERVAIPGSQHYTFALPTAVLSGSYVLSFRLDPFTNTQSSIVITNVSTGLAVTQPTTLQISSNTTGARPVLVLTGPAGFNYLVQGSTNFANWDPVAVIINTNGSVPFIDPAATNFTRRFYRAVAP